jgi:SH3 domain/Variant SH3 domain
MACSKLSDYIIIEPGRVYDTWARAICDYEKGSETELELRKGDIIEVMNKLETGWYNGTKDSLSRGWFPASCVEPTKSPLPQEEGKVINVWARALRDHPAGDKDGLEFKKGDRITVTHKLENGQWRGVMKGVDGGWFPSSYVESDKGPTIIEGRFYCQRDTRI